jgi:transposase InsO family protein
MVDEGVAFLSASSVYRILKEAHLVHRWSPRRRKPGDTRLQPLFPDQVWQADIMYVKVADRNYYLVQFVDAYSRYITHQELMTRMDGDAVSLAAAAALEKLEASGSKRVPVIQTDNGSGFISREFKVELSQRQITHQRIHPHCPEQNGIIERTNRTVREQLSEVELKGLTEAREVLGRITDWYNHERRHSSLHFLRPVDYYRGNPETLLEQRRLKLQQARHRRREANLELQQGTLPLEKSA